MSRPLPETGSVLLVRLRSIGDAVLMTALADAIRRQRPALRLSALLEPAAAALLRGQPLLDEVLVAPRTVRGRLGAVLEIRRRRFDLALDLHGGPTAAWMTALSRARRRVGLDAYRHRRAYTELLPAPHKSADPAAAEHTVTTNLALARALGLAPATDVGPSLTPTDAADRAATQALERASAPGRGYVALHPGAALASKTWPWPRFVSVAERILATGQPCVVLSAPGWSAPTPPPPGVALLPAVPLDILLAILSRARLFVGNDSGPAHMAAATGVPTVTVFGSQNPRVWRPWGSQHTALSAALECCPCPGFRCPQSEHLACLERIDVATVWSAIAPHLRAARDAS